MNLKEFNLEKKDYYIILIITLFSIILTIYYIKFNENFGIYCSDVYVYLLNALYFTGVNVNSTQTIYLSPIICYLTSILFNLGLKDITAIYIITGMFAIIGNIALYILLKIKFSKILSLCGVILYSTFAINLTWLSNGSLDIPAVSITIWIMLLGIIAISKNSKYYLILPTVFVIGFFTRYTSILIFPVLVLYYLYYNKFKKEDLKYLLYGTVIALIIASIILITIQHMSNGFLGFDSQISGGVSGKLGSSSDLAYNNDVSYYLTNFINFISASKIIFINRTPVLENPTLNSLIIYLILIIGCLLYIPNIKLKDKKLPILILIIASLTFTHLSSFITILLVFLGLLLIGKDSENKTGIVMLSWLLVYFLFFSYYPIKVNRYIIPSIPPLIYLLLASIRLINEKIKINNNIIPICLIVLFLIQGFTFCLAFEDTNQFIAPKEMSDYIINTIDYNNIGVYNLRPYNWYLGENMIGIESNNITKIKESNIDYYISDTKLNNLNNFKEIKNIDNLYLYKKNGV